MPSTPPIFIRRHGRAGDLNSLEDKALGMIDWARGGLTGSLNRWVHREVKGQQRTPAARHLRYGVAGRLLRGLLRPASVHLFILIYVAIDVLAVILEWAAVRFVPCALPAWTASGFPSIDLKTLILYTSGYLLGAQVGALGVMSLALALVTMIAQREQSNTDVQIYYHESMAFELVSSSIALIIVICVQLLWPLQFLLHRLGEGTGLMVFKLLLLAVHLVWLCANLSALAHFIATTFLFVQQNARERMRERFTANVLQPAVMTRTLRSALYRSAGANLLAAPEAGGGAEVMFGYDSLLPHDTEIKSIFKHASEIADVRMLWVQWACRRWADRAAKVAPTAPAGRNRTLLAERPQLLFAPRIDERLHGEVGWCRRRGGVPLDRVERTVLRFAFRFRRHSDEA